MKNKNDVPTEITVKSESNGNNIDITIHDVANFSSSMDGYERIKIHYID